MSSASEVRDLLTRFNLRARKSLGQNFLVDDAALDRIAAAAEIGARDWILEIGPGLGTLTRRLAQAAGRVVAVEIDQNLIPPLRLALAGHSNVDIVHGDILQLDPFELISDQVSGSGPSDSHSRTVAPAEASTPAQLSHYRTNPLTNYKVVANLPYYITSAVIRRLLEATRRPSLLILTMQLEVAQRIVAAPGDLSLLAVSVQFYGRPALVARINAGSFYPVPKVDSAVVRIDVHPQPPVAVSDVDHFFAIVKAGFGQKRKQIHNALKAGLAVPPETITAALAQANVDPKRRAETLTLQDWAAVVEALAKK
ncbi:MAG TPA: 16S rRNA (adenine(1518)-N(6)/adenine(1519)-N(6))-dimethyltransferase RsmA [Anaerolineae bacterium]|nr:16S rRNA (adenine(1518)-N(6)/adenine(1519)-N(6))-dimethyltransferase RsmA [Anaerolineae bacterium]